MCLYSDGNFLLLYGHGSQSYWIRNHSNDLLLIISAKTLIPKRVVFTYMRDEDFNISFFCPQFYFFILFFKFYFILLYNTVLVLSYINMNLSRVYMSSQSWTPFPPPSPYHLSGSSQCTSPKHPVSCIEPRLVIHFLHDIIHVSMPFSQIISPSPVPTESKSLLYTPVSCCLAYRVIVTIFLNFIYMC